MWNIPVIYMWNIPVIYMWNKLIKIYLTILDYVISLYKYLKAFIFSITKMYSIDNNNKNNLYYKYLLLKIPYIGEMLKKTIDEKMSLVKVELSNSNCKRDIIFKDTSIMEIVKSVPLLKKDISDINEILMHRPNCIIMDILLDDKSIKNLIDHYADKSKKYDHSLANVLKIKNIKTGVDSKIKINYIMSYERKIMEYNANDIIDIHVSDLYNIG